MADVETSEKPVLTFDDKDYVIDTLSDTAKYFVTQLQDLASQEAQTKARLDQVVVAAEGFKTMLENQIEEDENPKPDEPVEGEVMQ